MYSQGRDKSINPKDERITEEVVLVISDHEKLSRAIEIILTYHLGLQVLTPSPEFPEEQMRLVEAGEYNLLVLALSPSSELVVPMLEASLQGKTAQVPHLIISDKPYITEPNGRFIQMNFPFSAGELSDKVNEARSRYNEDGSRI